MSSNDSFKSLLFYGFLGLLPVCLVELLLLPRFPLPLPVLMPVCVVAVAVLEGSVFGCKFGFLTGLVWFTLYAAGSPGRIPLLVVIGMAAGAISQYALRKSLLGCMVCTGGVMAILSLLNIFRGVINAVADPGQAILVAGTESILTLLCTPLIYLLFSKLHRKMVGRRD